MHHVNINTCKSACGSKNDYLTATGPYTCTRTVHYGAVCLCITSLSKSQSAFTLSNRHAPVNLCETIRTMLFDWRTWTLSRLPYELASRWRDGTSSCAWQPTSSGTTPLWVSRQLYPDNLSTHTLRCSPTTTMFADEILSRRCLQRTNVRFAEIDGDINPSAKSILQGIPGVLSATGNFDRFIERSFSNYNNSVMTATRPLYLFYSPNTSFHFAIQITSVTMPCTCSSPVRHVRKTWICICFNYSKQKRR